MAFVPNGGKEIRITINGKIIPDFSGYSYVDAKSFFSEPTRSSKGVINKLNSYATFLTPKLRFDFKYMSLEAYRMLMKLIKEYNEFIVTAYDPVEDQYVTRKMYFKPKDFPNLHIMGYKALATQNESFELVGTNADEEILSLVYHKNDGTGTTTGLSFNYGDEVKIGDYDSTVSIENPRNWAREGYTLTGWNTMANGSGTRYVTNHIVTFSTNTALYAQWEAQ